LWKKRQRRIVTNVPGMTNLKNYRSKRANEQDNQD